MVDSTWYGGVNVTSSRACTPRPWTRRSMEFVNRDEAVHVIDTYSYGLGAMDCFCEMVSAGLKIPGQEPPLGDTRENGIPTAGCRKLQG